MIPQYRMITDFDLYEHQFQENSRFSAPVFHKDDFLKETQDNDLENDHFFSPSRSLKTKRLQIQTSFDSNMLNQHILGFKKSLEKLMEKTFPSQKQVQGLEWIKRIYSEEQDNAFSRQKLTQLIKNDQRLFDSEEKKKFIADLQSEEKLNEFLSSLAQIGHRGLFMELIFVADLLWQAYVPKQEIGLSEKQIEELVEELLDAQKITVYLQKLQYLNFSKSNLRVEIGKKEMESSLMVFLKQFGVTVLLVVEQYFKNPYSKDCQPKVEAKRGFSFKDISNDEFSDDEEEIIFSLGHKKRNI